MSYAIQTTRHFLFLLLLLLGVGTCPTARAEPPTRIDTSFRLALFNGSGIWRGLDLFIFANGMAYARVQRPPQENESGTQERHYKIQLSTNEIQTLAALLNTNKFLTLTGTDRTVWHESETGATIMVGLTNHWNHQLTRLESDAPPGFKAIHEHLLGIIRRAEKTQPVFEGKAVWLWIPEGFEL